MEQKILELLRTLLELEEGTELGKEDQLSDFGLTSILFIQFIVKLEEEFQIEIFDSDLTLKKFESVQATIDTLQKYLEPERNLKKVIVCDCDNVLWRGIAGEENLKIGFREYKIQQALEALYKSGVLLCLCSKNEEKNIRNAFSHSAMVLSWEHIVAYRINRRDKAFNLRKIAEELNLPTDSFVFVDDSDYELGLINGLLPEVLTVKADNEGAWVEELSNLFQSPSSPSERNRTILYREQKEREKNKILFSTVEEYNLSLNTIVSCGLAEKSQFPRLAELSQRTNQCNLSVSRYSQQELEKLAEDPAVSVFALSARDKYGDMGIVAGAVLRKEAEAVIESFFVSCRVFQRGFEEILLSRLLSEAHPLSVKGRLKKTEKNKKYHDFYQRNGVFVCE